MRSRVTSLALFSIVTALVTGGVTLALAQPRGRGPTPKPAAAPKADAAVPAPKHPADVEEAGAPAAAPAAATALPASGPTDAGAAAPAPTVPSYYDGGQKPSPLNPAPGELSPAQQPPPGTIDYDKLLSDISALRARIATVQDGLFHSRIAVSVQTDGDHGKVGRLAVLLDDGIVYTAPASFRAEDMTVVYDHAVAPGKHAVSVDVERKDDRDESFRTAQRTRFVVDVPKDQKLSLEVRLYDDSTMGADFPSDRNGKYELKVRARAYARPVGK